MANKKPFDYSNLIAIIPIGLLLFALLCIYCNWFFLGNNARVALHESVMWWIGGTLLLIGSGVAIVARGSSGFGWIIFGGILLGLSICAYCGFNFSIA